MKTYLLYISISILLISCGNQPAETNYLFRVFDPEKEEYGYINTAGDTIIPFGKYNLCFTDTLKTYAIVTSPEKGLIGIDRNENIKYQVFNFDNGPDYPSEGLFRIIQNNKIGYADILTGEIIITPPNTPLPTHSKTEQPK